MVDGDEENLVRGQLDELHAKHRTIGDADVVSFYPPEAEADRHLFGLAASERAARSQGSTRR